MSTKNIAFEIPISDIEAKPEFFTEITHTLYGNTKISRHDATGNYFITGIVKAYNEEKLAEYEVLRSKLPSLRRNLEKAKASGDVDDIAIAEARLNDIESSQKPIKVEINAWLRIDNTKKFLTDFKNTIGCSNEQVAFKIMGGVNEFRGTYVHRYVMHHLLHWMDSMYAIKVAQLLDRYLVEETERYKDQAEEAKTNELKAKKRYKKLNKRFDEQSEQMKEQSEQMKEQSDKLDKLLDYANNLTISTCYLVDKTEDLTLTADCSQEKLNETLEYVKENQRLLKEKSYKSTIDPKNKQLITHFCVLKPKCPTDHKTLIIRAQHKHIQKKIAEYEDTHSILIPITYNANSITLMNNAKSLYNKMRGTYVKEYNTAVNKRNKKLLNEIIEYNKHRDDKDGFRNYVKEKEPALLTETVTNLIKFNTTNIMYYDNPYIPYDDVIGCIRRMNEETQRSPSDEYDEEDTLDTIKCVNECIDSASTAIKNLPIDTTKARKRIK
jgi:hypothetical protein